MQNQPFEAIGREYAPIRLDPSFPASASRHEQSDMPIESMHIHDVIELGYCHSGSGIFVVEGKILPFRQGCGLVINSDAFHRASSTPGTTSSWTFMYFDLPRLIRDPGIEPELLHTDRLGGPDFPNVVPPSQDQALCVLLRELALEIEGKPDGYQACVRGLLVAVMARLHRLPGCGSRKEAGRGGALERIAPALGMLTRRIAEEVKIEKLAEACHMSLSHFRRTFNRAVGQSPKAYQLRLSVHAAATMLQNDDRPIIDIAYACGFKSLSSFNRHFRRFMSMAPREWRTHKSVQ